MLLRVDWDAATGIAVELDKIKDQLRIHDEQFDSLITDLHLPGALDWAEGVMHRAIISRTHRAVFSDFPRGRDQMLKLPRGNVIAIESIKYTSNDAVTTMSGPSSAAPSTDYQETITSPTAGRVYPAVGEAWPNVDLEAVEPVLVTYTAGWAVADIPATIKLALTVYVSDALDIVGAADMGAGITEKLNQKDMMLSPYRLDSVC